MFIKGDKVVYPLYGAGVIEDLEEKDIDGRSQMYYVMTIPVGDLRIMVSAGKAEGMGIRKVYGKDEVMKIISGIENVPIEMAENWNQRYKDNMDKIKTGKLIEVVEVFRNLLMREKDRGLSSAEKKMLTTTKQIILSEIILSQNIDKVQAEEMLISCVK